MLRLMITRLAASDLSLLKKIELSAPSLPPRDSTASLTEADWALDEEALRKSIRKKVEEDESWYYKEDNVSRHERTTLYTKALHSFSKEAMMFCQNTDLPNSLHILEALMDEAIPDYEEVDDSYGSLGEAYQALVNTWKYVLQQGRQSWSLAKLQELADTFSLAHASSAPYGYNHFLELQQLVEEMLLDQTLKYASFP